MDNEVNKPEPVETQHQTNKEMDSAIDSECNGETEAKKIMYIKMMVTIAVIVIGAFVFFKMNADGSGYIIDQKADKSAGYSWVYEISNNQILDVTKTEYKNGKFIFNLAGIGEGKADIEFTMIKDGNKEKIYKDKVYSFEVNEDKQIIFKKLTIVD